MPRLIKDLLKPKGVLALHAVLRAGFMVRDKQEPE